MGKNQILIADDAEINRQMLKFIFEEQFEILEAADGVEAISQIESHKDSLAIIFLDLLMPNKDGLDVLEFMSEQGYLEFIPVIMITGEATAESDEKAYDYGAMDIIYKPFAPRVVMRRTRNILELFERRTDLEEQLEQRTKELVESRNKVEKTNEFLINTLSAIAEYRNVESGSHIRRVKYLARIILNYLMKYYPEYGLTKESVNMIVNAAALHDIGKVAIPDSILFKTGDLSKEETEELKKHTIYGCELLEQFKQEGDEFYKYCYDICRYHHERVDGNGYPDGLKGEEIPIWAQVVAIVDVYDHLANEHSYTLDEAIYMIKNGEFGEFSKEILDCFDLAKFDFVQAQDVLGSLSFC